MIKAPGITVDHGDGKQSFHPIGEPGLYVIQLFKVENNIEKVNIVSNIVSYFEIGKLEELELGYPMESK